MRFVRAIASVGKILGSKPVNPISLLQRDLAELTATIQGNPGQYPITFKLADGSPADVTCISRLARAEELRTNNPMETISIKSRSPSIEGFVRWQSLHPPIICSKPIQRAPRRISQGLLGRARPRATPLGAVSR